MEREQPLEEVKTKALLWPCFRNMELIDFTSAHTALFENAWNDELSRDEVLNHVCSPPLKRRDFLQLTIMANTFQEQWLGDDIIDATLNRICKNSILSVACVESWKGKLIQEQSDIAPSLETIELFEKQLVFFPVCKDNHWALVVFVPGHASLEYYDSFQNSGVDIMEIVAGFLNAILQLNEYEPVNFIMNNITGIPEQSNDWDCGIFLLSYAKCLANERSFRFKKEDACAIRTAIALDMLSNDPHDGNLEFLESDGEAEEVVVVEQEEEEVEYPTMRRHTI